MRALTLHQPWAYAVAHLGKRVKNRTRRPPESVIGQRIAIHAGKQVDPRAWERLQARIPHAVTRRQRGVIVATARVVGVVGNIEALPDDQREWWIGPVGWLLDDVRTLDKPVLCKGQQGLWPVPPAVAAQIIGGDIGGMGRPRRRYDDVLHRRYCCGCGAHLAVVVPCAGSQSNRICKRVLCALRQR